MIENENQNAKWRKSEPQRLAMPVVGLVLRKHFAAIADIRSAILGSIGVEPLKPTSRMGNADEVIVPHDGGEIANDEGRPILIVSDAKKC